MDIFLLMQLMSQCLSGSTNTLAQGSCTYLESTGSLEMSGMMQAAAQAMSFGVLISEKARIIHDTWEGRSMMVWAEQWELCCV